MRFLLDVDDVAAHLTAHVYLVSGTNQQPKDQLYWDFLRRLPPREKYLARFFMQSPVSYL